MSHATLQGYSTVSLEPDEEQHKGRRFTRAQVLQWFQDKDNHDAALHVLNKIDHDRWPEIFSLPEDTNDDISNHIVKPARRKKSPPTLHRQKTSEALKGAFIQFAKDSRHAKESDATVSLLILKLGDLSEASEVTYYSEELEKNLQTHEHAQGKAVFAQNQSICEIEVKILDRDAWARCRTFVVKLRDPVNATLTEQMSIVYVNVYDKDRFPSNRYVVASTDENQEMEGHEPEIDGLRLLWEYIKMAWGDKKVFRATLWRCLMVQARNIRVIVMLITFQFLVDRVLTEPSVKAQSKGILPHIGEKEGHQFLALVVLNSFSLVLVGIEHFAAYLKLQVSVGGPLRRDLQTALLERMLYYTEDSLTSLTTGKFLMAMARDSLSLVCNCHNKVIVISSIWGEIVVLHVYFIFSPFLFGKGFHPLMLLACMTYPCLLSLILCWRRTSTYEAMRDLNSAQDSFVNVVVSILHRIRLILGYRQRPAAMQWTRERIDAYNAARRKSNIKLMHNTFASHWVTQLVSVAVSVYFGTHVLDKTMSIGVYLVSVSATRKLGRAWTKMYTAMMGVHGVTPQLKNIAGLLNAQTDLEGLEAHDMQGNKYIERFHAHFSDKFVSGKDLDEEPIKILVKGLSGNVECVIPQGQLVAIYGVEKGALLRHISATSPMPRTIQGNVFMPPHLHVVFVSREPEFNVGTLFENLVFGVPRSRKQTIESEMDRVVFICKELGIHQQVIEDIQQMKVMPTGLSVTQLSLLHLARALISDPEVLCMQKPTMLLPLPKSRKVFLLLKQFVRQRGLGRSQRQEDIYARRARTCIFTCSKAAHETLSFAHTILQAKPDGTLNVMPAEFWKEHHKE